MVRKVFERLNNLQEKKQVFLDALNDKLPREFGVQSQPSATMNNVENVLIHTNGMVVDVYGLIQDKDGSVHWFKNTTGQLY